MGLRFNVVGFIGLFGVVLLGFGVFVMLVNVFWGVGLLIVIWYAYAACGWVGL